MENILSVIGIVVSTVALIVSVWLFDLSLDNSREVLLHKIDYFITYDHNIMSLFADLTVDEKQKKCPIKEEDIEKFNQSIFELTRLLNDIRYSYISNPIIYDGSKPADDGKSYIHEFYVKKAYDYLLTYFQKRYLPNFKLYLEHYDDRLYLKQHYLGRIIYKRRCLIGPIIGYKVIYKRRHKYAVYGQIKIKLIKSIRNEKDYKKYYDKCYTKIPLSEVGIRKKTFERTISDFETPIDAPTITIYR